MEGELLFVQTALDLGCRRRTWLHPVRLRLSQHFLTTVFGTKHACNNFRSTFENLKLNIHIIAFNIYRPLIFKKKEGSPFCSFTESPNVFWLPCVYKALELNVEMGGMRPTQEADILIGERERV